ncbi:MAG: methionine--tRNA ligase subunit beta [Candidatus ainarchaeum sp.]|nr:methionine--tRNA ligase subunit beta [Candidatus ainarchaeum sp.]MDD5096332.1 methionine--tRNA ligase subunit beta [Candidatus ainarchaeum sp.]
MVAYEEFEKLDLRAARVLSAERVEGSDKLLRLEVDLGVEKRQLVAGIGKHYAPDEVVGKQIVVLANLEARKIKGLESQGMLLAAWDEGNVVLLTLDREMKEGSRIG